MNNPVKHVSLTQPSRFELPAAYQQRFQPDYFTAQPMTASLGSPMSIRTLRGLLGTQGAT